MPTDDPLTNWLDKLRKGDDEAAERLWRHFHKQLEKVARKKIHPTTRKVYDEQDAAQSAFISFCKGIEAGRFPDLNDSEGLRRILMVITSRKVSHRHRHDHQKRRDVKRQVTGGILRETGHDVVGDLPGREPTAEFTAAFSETCETLVDLLEKDSLKKVALAKLQGFSDSEIATKFDCSRRTIQRRLEIIRRIWQEHEW